MKKFNYIFIFFLFVAFFVTTTRFDLVSKWLGSKNNFRNIANENNRAMFIDSYRDAMQVRFDHFKTEAEEINVIHFIVREDVVGLTYLAELREAVKRGVKVRVIFDHFGSTGSSSKKKLSTAMIKHLTDAGVDVKIFNVFSDSKLKRLKNPKQYLQRMHEKIILFRGHKTFMVGDRDLSGRYFGFTNPGEKFLSRDLFVNGSESRVVEDHFDSLFNGKFTQYYPYEEMGSVPTEEEVKAAGKRLDDAFASSNESTLFKKESNVKKWSARARQVRELKFLGDTPDSIDFVAHKKLLEIIGNARKKVSIETPYLILNKDNHEAIKSARRNGSAVEVVTNNAYLTDEVWVPPAADEDLRKLMADGSTVFENVDARVFHTKSYVVDGSELMFGSNNFDNRSQRWDRESSVYINDEEMAKELSSLIERDKKMTQKMDINSPSYRSKSCRNMFLWFLSSVVARPIL